MSGLLKGFGQGLGIAIGIGTGIAVAAFAVPNGFQPGAPVSSSAMNANFTAISAKLDSIDESLAVLQTNLSNIDDSTNTRMNDMSVDTAALTERLVAIEDSSNELDALTEKVDAIAHVQRYRVSTTNAQILVSRQGHELPRGFLGVFVCGVDGTDAEGFSAWLVKRAPNGSVYVDNYVSGSISTNTPEIFDWNGAPAIRLYNHAAEYDVACYVTQLLPSP